MAPTIFRVRTCALAALTAAAVALGAGPDELSPRRDLFGTKDAGREGAQRDEGDRRVRGAVVLSDGRRVEGTLSLTLDHALSFFDLERDEWREVALSELSRLEARARAEEIDKEWRWKEAGHDVKVYTGRTRPRRWLDHDVVLKDGSRFTGHIKGTVIYVETNDTNEEAPGEAGSRPKRKGSPRPSRERFFLRQYDRGDWGDTLEGLVYVKSIIVDRPGIKSAPRASRSDGPGESRGPGADTGTGTVAPAPGGEGPRPE